MVTILLQDSACEYKCESSSETDSEEVSIGLTSHVVTSVGAINTG